MARNDKEVTTYINGEPVTNDERNTTNVDECRRTRIIKPQRKLVSFSDGLNRPVKKCRNKCQNNWCRRYSRNICGCSRKYRCQCFYKRAQDVCDTSPRVAPNVHEYCEDDETTKDTPQNESDDDIDYDFLETVAVLAQTNKNQVRPK